MFLFYYYFTLLQSLRIYFFTLAVWAENYLMWFKVKDYEYISPLGGGVGVIWGFILPEGRQIFLEN